MAGIVLYVLDTLVLVALQEWMAVGFHGLAMVGLWSGLKALRALQQAGTPPAAAATVADR